MATKENKVSEISVNTLKEIIKAEKPTENTVNYKFGDNQIGIVVKNTISKDDKIRFARDVSKGCFIDDEYVPYYREELFKIAVLEYFTNIKTDIGDTILFDLVNSTGVYDFVVKNMSENVIYDLIVLIDDMVEWHKQEILSIQKQRLDAATEDMEKTLEQMGEIVEALNTMTKSFEGIDPKKALEVYEKIANKDEDKITNAVIDFSLAKIDK